MQTQRSVVNVNDVDLNCRVGANVQLRILKTATDESFAKVIELRLHAARY